jgi:hypothetical protein
MSTVVRDGWMNEIFNSYIIADGNLNTVSNTSLLRIFRVRISLDLVLCRYRSYAVGCNGYCSLICCYSGFKGVLVAIA